MNLLVDNATVVESAVAALVLLVFVSIFGTPPEWITGQSDTAIGAAIAAGVWILPSLLSGLVLYRIRHRGFQWNSLLLGGVSLAILSLTVTGVYAVYRSNGLVTYEGRGVLVGPLLALVAGCLLAITILISNVRQYSDRKLP
ncbi:hypothetical protein [Natrinema salsiterrestre]|uniref:Uncharacterized protein n=1 Tax=Natrinema salsiterrestre TaxID=2950540 RepID=A0A9Q4L1L4_9EURY|nr:hypothetical protein [Natrinema salsiterrestre]MDF9745669.1 hypothetical protein [Natrinema salsiterrestre]